MHSKTKDAASSSAYTNQNCASTFVPFVNLFKNMGTEDEDQFYTQLFPETVYNDLSTGSSIGRFEEISYVGFSNRKD